MPGSRCARRAAQDDPQTNLGQADAGARLCPGNQSGLGDGRYRLWWGLQTTQLARGAPAALRLGRAEEPAHWAHPPRRFCRGQLACRTVATSVGRGGQPRATLLRLGLAVVGFSLDGAWVEAVAARPTQPV